VVFVFDEAFLREARFGFGRLLFIYESVMDVFASRPAGSCSIRLGGVVEEARAFAKERGASRLVTTRTVGDRFAAYKREFEAGGLRVTAYAVPELVPYPEVDRVPKRFSVWWREVESAALSE